MRFEAHPGHLAYEVLYDAQRDLLITCGNEPTIRIWDARTGEPRGILEGHTGAVDVILLHPDGSRLFSGSTDHTIRVWDLETRTSSTVSGRMREKVLALSLSIDGSLLAAGMTSGHMLVWDLQRNAVRIEGKLKDQIDRIRFDATAGRVFAVDLNGVVWEWQVPASGESSSEPSSPASVWQDTGIKPYDVQLSPDGLELLMARRDGRVHAFPLSAPANDDFMLRFSLVRDFNCLKDGRIVVSEDRQLILVDPKSAAQAPQVLAAGVWPSLAASPDDSLLSAKSTTGEVAVWRLSDGQKIFKRDGATPGAYQEMSFSSDSRWLALANSNAGCLEIVDTRTGEVARQFESPLCWHALFSASGNLLAFDALRGPPAIGRELRLLDWPSGELRATVPSRSVYAGTHVISPDGRLVAVAADRTVQLFETQTGQLRHELFGHRGAIQSVSFSPDSRRLVTAGDDACVKLWHVSTGQNLLDFSSRSSQSAATGAQFTADGCWLVYSTNEHAIHFIRLK